MSQYELGHLSDEELLRNLETMVTRDRRTTASLLAHIAEVDERKLYVPAGYSSMHAYCVDDLRLSEDVAYKRIRAARTARMFPVLFDAVAEGRLHLAAVCLIASHLTPENANELIVAATRRPKSEIEVWLARRFGAALPERRAVVSVIAARPPAAADPRGRQLAPGPVGTDGNELQLTLEPARAAAAVASPSETAPTSTEATPPFASAAPPHVDGASPRIDVPVNYQERYMVKVTISKSTHDKLRHAQALLSHAVPAGDIAQVLDRALDVLIARFECKRIGPGPNQAVSRRDSKRRARHIPAQVRRAVWERDQGQCTFVGTNGTRCNARHYLEFDHVVPLARGGEATVGGLRLRCRAHNQHEAERGFGTRFMERKREEARRAAANRREPT